MWEEIGDWYKINRFGIILNTKTQRIMKSSNDKDGYRIISLFIDGKRVTRGVHRLVMELFKPNPNNLPQINHKNGIKFDNWVGNLEYCTAKENTQHAYDTGLKYGLKCENHGRAKLTQQQVNEIRTKYAPRKYSMRKLAKEYGVNKSQIHNIIHNKCWVKPTHT